MDEFASIQVKRYRTPDGAPTCCRNWQSGELCQFLGSRRFGAMPVCMLGEQIDMDKQRPDQWITPHNKCLVWAEKKDSNE
jgi:hypothetical protein